MDDQIDGDSELAGVLDEYLAALQRGDRAQCHLLCEKHPQLIEFKEQIEALDRLSPDVNYASAITDLLSDAPARGPDDPQLQETLLVDPFGVPKSSSHGDWTGAASGNVFGRYELLDELGRGGMGVVFRARQADLDRLVAVKMILASRLASADEVRRFYQEARAAGGLRHPHIVAIHEVGEVRGQHFFSMDWINGPSLADVLAAGVAPRHDSLRATVPPSWSREEAPAPLNELGSETATPASTTKGPSASGRWRARGDASQLSFEQIASIVRDISRAVDYLHSHQIVHRDIKPSNILLTSDGVPHLTDFGLAKCRVNDADQTNSGAIVGTPLYMSPEQAAGRGADVGPRSDIYSLGAILYQALTGRPPHHGSNPMRILVAVMEHEPELPRSINPQAPRELEAICLKCLEKDVAGRYASAAELAEDLDRYLRGEPVGADAAGIGHRIRRWMRREPALASRWGALIVGALILHAAFKHGDVTAVTHERFEILFLMWGLSALLFHRSTKLESEARVARFVWLAVDAVFVTRLLFLAGHPVGPLVVVYPLLVAASGLFFDEALVYFMTSVSLMSYATLIWLVPEEATPPHYCLSFAAVLVVMGLVTAHQVHRIRTLSRLHS